MKIQASGVVLRGEGMGDTGTILIGTGNPRKGGPGGGQGTLIMVGGAYLNLGQAIGTVFRTGAGYKKPQAG